MSRAPLRPRSDYRVWRSITTRWRDNDAYGHVNNAVYYGWFDTAVNAWLIEAGLLDVAQSDPIGLVVETGCQYAASVAFPQVLAIGLSVTKIGTSSVTYRLGVFPEAAPTAAAEGFFTHVYVDRQTRRPVPIPLEWRAKLQEMI